MKYAMSPIDSFEIPRSPSSSTELNSHIPSHSTSLYLYAILATWQHEHAPDLLLELERILTDQVNRVMMLSSPHVLVESRLITNIIQLITRYVHSLDQSKVIKTVLGAIELEQDLVGENLWWVSVWRKVMNICNWEVALELLLDKQVTDLGVWEVFASTGKIMIAERLLEHHHEYLVYNVKCQSPGCGHRETWHMRAEYLEMMVFMSGAIGPWQDIGAQFYKLAFEITLATKEFGSEEARVRRRQLQEARKMEQKYRKVISKHMRIDEDDIEGRLDDLLSTEKTDDREPAHLPRTSLPSSITAGTRSLKKPNPSHSSFRASYPNSLRLQDSSQSSPLTKYGNFQVLFQEWSDLKGVDFPGRCGSFNQVLGSFKDSMVFRQLIDWTATHVQRRDQMPFLKAMVRAYLLSPELPAALFLSRKSASDIQVSNSSANALPSRLHVTYIPNWVTVKDFLLDNKDYVPRSTNEWTGLEFPEVTILRLFGECCLDSLQSHLSCLLKEEGTYDDTPIFIAKYRDNLQTVLSNLSAWNIRIDPIFEEFFRESFHDAHESSEVLNPPIAIVNNDPFYANDFDTG